MEHPGARAPSTLHPVGHGPEMLQEHWILHFCEKAEKEQLLLWLKQEGLERPRLFEDRVAHAEKLRSMSNSWYKKQDYRRALHCIMGAVHALDWPPVEQTSQSPEQVSEVARAMLPVMSNAAMIFLKRGDFRNAVVAGTAGLRCAGRLPEEETKTLRAKLLWRRGIARGEADARDLEEALRDLKEAASLEPENREIRECLANCKAALQEERRNDPIRYRPAAKRQSGKAGEDDGVVVEGEEEGEPLPTPRQELSPAAERFAKIVGTCLGRSRRYCRSAREAFRERRASSAVVAVAVPALGLIMAVAVGRLFPSTAPSA